jgi:translation initiation factor 2 subunit 2
MAEDDVITLEFSKKRKTKKVAEKPEFEQDIYPYGEMLQMIYDKVTVIPDKKPLVFGTLNIGRIGTKKTCLHNFGEVCDKINRDPKHVMITFMKELGTTGTLSADNSLILNGRFSDKHFEHSIKYYSNKYVKCLNCGLYNTSFVKENKINYIDCKDCFAKKAMKLN